MTDVLIYEQGTGGDALLKGNDLATLNGYENSPYLSMFGGDNTFWGNYLMPDNIFSSKTAAILNKTPLSSAGRKTIEDAINADLSFLNNIPGTTWTLFTAITNANRLRIDININGQLFSYEWNPDKLFLTYLV